MNAKTKQILVNLIGQLHTKVSARDECIIELALAEAELSGYAEASNKFTEVLKRRMSL